MNLFHAQGVGSWVLRTSVEASLIALLVLAAQWLLGNRISARWRYNLWLLVILRLILPVFPQSRLSPFNWMSVGKVAAAARDLAMRTTKLRTSAQPLPMPKARPMHSDSADPPLVAQSEKNQNEQFVAAAEVVQQPEIRILDDSMESSRSFNPAKVDGWHGQVLLPVFRAPQLTHGQEYLPVPPSKALSEPKNISFRWRTRWISYALATWSCGCALLALRVFVMSWRLGRTTRRLPAMHDPQVLALFSECCTQVRITRRPALLEAPRDFAPALVGVVRPKLLLSRSVVCALAPNELRLVLLHELVHLKRRDVAMNFALSLLLCLHWFNPLLWWSFARMRADRELACDEAVLALGQSSRRHDDRRDYGSAMIKLLETFAACAVAPAAAVGVLDASPTMRGAQMRRRISMIAQFNKPKRWSLAGMALSGALAAVALTGAVSGQQQPPAAPGTDPTQPNPAMQQQHNTGLPAAGRATMRPGAAGMPGMMGQPAQKVPGDSGAQPGEGGGIGGIAAPPAAGSPGGLNGGGIGAVPGMPGAAGMGGGPGPAIGGPPPGGLPGIGAVTPPPAPGEPMPLFSGMVEGPEAARADAKSLEKLRKAIPVALENIPLRDAMTYVSDQTGVDVFIDTKAMEQAGVPADAAVNLRIRQPLPGDEVLRLMLRSAAGDELGYGILHGVVYVTTREQLEMSRVTRAYDVSDFENQSDQLQRAVMRTIAPNSWDTNGGSGSVLILGHKMIVTAAEPNQREIAKLLELLRDNEPARRTQTTTPGMKSDAGAEGKVFRLKNTEAGEAAQQLRAAISLSTNATEKLPQVFADQRTNSILVSAPEQKMGQIEAMISKLDGKSDNRDGPRGNDATKPSADASLQIEIQKTLHDRNDHTQSIVTQEAQLKDLLAKYGEQHPTVVALRKQLDAQKDYVAHLDSHIAELQREVPTKSQEQLSPQHRQVSLHIPGSQPMEVPADMEQELRQLWESKYKDRLILVDGKEYNRHEIEAEFQQDAAQRISARAARQAADGSAQKASQQNPAQP